MVTVFDARPHGFETGDWIEFKEVAGMTELNGKQLQITGRLLCSLITDINYTGLGSVSDQL